MPNHSPRPSTQSSLPNTAPNTPLYTQLRTTHHQRVSDGQTVSLLEGGDPDRRLLVLVWSQLGDFDSLEYAWWLQRDRDRLAAAKVTVRAVGIGDRRSGQAFCRYTGFPEASLYLDPTAQLHHRLGLYTGLTLKFPGLSIGQTAWLNLMLMCAGIGSPGTLAEVFRGYRGDRRAPQLIADDETVIAKPLPAFPGSLFKLAGGTGFQRPFELATLRLRNMAEVLGRWQTYVPDPAYMTQRGATFLFDRLGSQPTPTDQEATRCLRYEHRDRGILGFAENPSDPLSFLDGLN